MERMNRPVAVITGASGGIGKACALALAHAVEPFDVALQYRGNAASAQATSDEIQRAGVRAAWFQTDLSASGASAALIEKVANDFGPPAALVHAAGPIVEKPIAFTKPEDFDALLEVHAISAALLSKAMLRYIRKIDNGRIVYIGSLAGSIGLGNAAAYATCKGALEGLCKSLALEAARWQTTVNLIAPGYVDTEMTKSQDDEKRASLLAGIPLQRYANSDEIGALAAFLCSRGAGYITGQTIIIDGGASLG
jgi:3-oxoacyl-[acyl-carrier protein] reductase